MDSASDGQLTSVLLAMGIVGPLLFIAIFLLEDLTRPGFSPWRDFVSSLALSSQGWEQIANFIICGLCVVGFSIGVRQVMPTGPAHLWGPLLLAIFGLSLIVAGIFVTDPSLGYPPGAAVVQTWHGTIHGLNAPIAFGSVTAAAFVFSRRFLADPPRRSFGRYSLISGAALLIAFIGSIALATLDQKGVIPNAPVGILESAAIIIGWIWVAALGIRFRQDLHASGRMAMGR